MRWLKHLTRAHLDEKMTALIADSGLEGYGFFWLLCEVIGESIDGANRCDLGHPLAQWARILYCHHHKVAKYFVALAKVGLIEIVADVTPTTNLTPFTPGLPQGYPDITTPSNLGVTVEWLQGNKQGKIRVAIPKLLKYRDEYRARVGTTSGETPEQLPSKIEREIESTSLAASPSEKAPTLFPPDERDAKPPSGNTPSNGELLAGAIRKAAQEIHGRHPKIRRDISENEVYKKLTAIARLKPALNRVAEIERINRNHAEWCESRDWTKDAGQFSKGLNNWLAPTVGRYDAEAPTDREREEEDPYANETNEQWEARQLREREEQRKIGMAYLERKAREATA